MADEPVALSGSSLLTSAPTRTMFFNVDQARYITSLSKLRAIQVSGPTCDPEHHFDPQKPILDTGPGRFQGIFKPSRRINIFGPSTAGEILMRIHPPQQSVDGSLLCILLVHCFHTVLLLLSTCRARPLNSGSVPGATV